MKALIVIANYGTANDRYLGRVLQEYRSLPYEVTDLTVISNIPKQLGTDVKTVVAAAKESRRWLPHIHKRIFAENINRYDLFVYSEDDHLITLRNIEAFLEALRYVDQDELPGFMVSEDCPDGSLNFPAVHKHFAWDPASMVRRGPYTCAHFTNEHSACYVVTQERLRRAIASGGFLGPPHEGKYNFVCSAATDIYTQCGFRKLICISHLQDFTVRHLPNKYVGKAGISGQELERQMDALLRIGINGRLHRPLVAPTRLYQGLFSKSYYEPRRDDLIGLIPASATKVLSVGCGFGDTEAALVQKGIHVTAIPLDAVIAGAAQARGVKVVCGEMASVLAGLKQEKFDCALMTNLLHLFPDPVALLTRVSAALGERATLVITVPNHSYGPTMLRRLRNDHKLRHLGVYSKSGVHLTTAKIVAAWIRKAGLRLEKTINVVAARHGVAQRYTLGLCDRVLAEEVVMLASTRNAITCLSQVAMLSRSRPEAISIEDKAKSYVAR